LARARVGLCTCPDIEAGMGLGALMARHFVELGGAACLGLDITSFTRADLFAQARMLLQLERKRLAEEESATTFEIGYPTRAALELLTSGGARAIGRSDEIGSLTPGKQADVIIVRPDPLHAALAAHPASTLIFYTGPSDIDTVLVAGKVLKRDGQLVGIDVTRLRQAATAAFSRIKFRYERLPRDDLEGVWAGIF
jgi:cytosine/adenosine deaminase-related metal-dependent hydrolase